jgi:uncharacterized repeat protein (TIGR03806 family)
MGVVRSLGLVALFLSLSGFSLSGGGLDVAAPIGPYLDGALPSRTPTAASGDWELVRAYPNQVFVDPVAMMPVPQSNLLMVAEKWGALMIFPDEADIAARNVVLDLSAQTQAWGDSGLLGVVFHPEYGQVGSVNRDYLYVYYRYTPDPAEQERAYCRLSRFTWRSGPEAIDPATEFVLINQYDRHNWHNGGGLFFGNDGLLYLSIGDEGGSNDAYNVAQKRDGGLFSGVLRIDVDRDAARSHVIRRQPLDASPPPPGWPGSYTQGYFVPNDNPWPSPAGTVLEEFFAIGIRSPYRMTLDRPTGRIWLGDVGQSLEEEVNLIERGGNYQWPYFEGTAAGGRVRPAVVTGIETPPVLRYGRGEGGCVIGGLVYRGVEHPSLVGKYLYGDFNNGRIRTLDYTPGQSPVVEEIAKLGERQLTSFGTDVNGEAYLLTLGQTNLNGGLVYKLRLTGAAHPQPPATLSATGAFSNLSTLTPRPGLMPYDLVQALWSDGADKKRWLAIPNDGNPDTAAEQIGFSENGPWDFPVGAVLVKHFEYAGRRLETRFIVKGVDERFFGFTYRWRPDHSDADLLPGPAVEEVIPLPAGGSVRWHFPGRVECFECHTGASGTVLGPKTRHLHRDLLYPVTGRTANQIETLNDLGFFRNAPAPAAIPDFLAAANVNDASESLDRRARSYLDINCSHCHLPGGPTQAGFDARLTTPPQFQNLINVYPLNGLEYPDPRLVKPGVVADSVLPFRMDSLDTCCAMPPIAKNAIDADAVRVVTQWIASLDPSVSPGGRNEAPVPGDLEIPQLGLDLTGGPAVGRLFKVAVTASEPILGLTVADFSVRNGKVLALSGSGTSYTVTIQPRLEGQGSVDMPSDRVVDLNGHANRRLASPLFFDYEDPEIPVALTNLLIDGDFESGPGGWRRHGDTGLSPLAQSGTQGARLTGGGWISQSVPVLGATAYRLSGWSRAGDAAGAAVASIAFWDASGRWLGERRLAVPAGEGYDSFQQRLTSPPDAVFATFTVRAGEAGSALVDDLALTTSLAGDPPAGPLTENGDFETGLTRWTTENDVTLSALSHLGQGAARVGENSRIAFTRPVLPGNRLVVTGAYLTEGTPAFAEAGLSFLTASDELIATEKITLPPSATYRDFFFFADIPEAADHLDLWIRNGAGGSVTVDDIGLIYAASSSDPESEPRAPETDFEDGTLEPWQTVGTVTVSSEALSGATAAVLGMTSSLVASRATQSGESWRFRGQYRRSGEWAVSEAGLYFRDRDGELVSVTTSALSASSGTGEFEVDAIAPPFATSVSAWLYQGEAGTLTVDDLSLISTAAEGSPTPAAAVQSATHVRVAGGLTRLDLTNRDPGSFTDPRDEVTQPDLTIQAPGGSILGRDLYEPGAVRQKIVFTTGRRQRSSTFQITWQNDAVFRRDAAVLRGTGGNRFFRLDYFAMESAPLNVTAAVIAGRHQTSAALPGEGASYRVSLRSSGATLRPRLNVSLNASSLFAPARQDMVQIRLR